MFPLFLNVTNRLGVVIGGGRVGQRKLTALLEAGAQVRVVCLESPPPALTQPRLHWLTEPYRAGHLDGACLVFAAATAEINAQVVRDAQVRGLWVNAADHPSQGDFFVPATLRRGELVVAVSTAGAAPALARRVRQLLERQIDEAFGSWVALLKELRPLIRARISQPEQRRQFWERLCHEQWLERLRQEGPEAVRKALLMHLQTLAADERDPL